MNEDLRWRITSFFDYWRQRYDFIHDLDLVKYHHEANVLLWAALDALSILWAKNVGKSQNQSEVKKLIFDAFLARYGGEVFQIVSLPDIWNRVDKNESQKLPVYIRQFLSKIGDPRTTTLIEECQLRHSSDDWSLDEIITATLKEYPATDRSKLEKWLIWSRYGAIAYTEMRCAYIHEGRAGQGTHGFDLHESAIKPTYLSGIYTTPPTIGFSVEFMLEVLNHCIDKFEIEALELQQDPVPQE